MRLIVAIVAAGVIAQPKDGDLCTGPMSFWHRTALATS